MRTYVTGRRDPTRDARPVLRDTEARQGPSGRPVLIVLLASVVLLGLYMVAMMIWTMVDSPVAPREQAVQTDPPVVPSSALNADDPPVGNPAYPVPAVPRVD